MDCHPLLPMIACHSSDHSLKATFYNADKYPHLKLGYFSNFNNNILGFRIAYLFKALHLAIRNNKRLFKNTCSFVGVTIIKAEVG